MYFQKHKKLVIKIVSVITILITGFLAFQYFNEKTPDYTNIIKEVTKNTQLIDMNTDHNQALDVRDYAVYKKNIEIPEILINFDTHSDIFINFPTLNQKMTGIEDWINEILAKNPNTNEVYWVMPESEARHTLLQILFAINDYRVLKKSNILYGNSLNLDIPWYKFILSPITQKAYVQNLLLDTQTGRLNEISNDEKINRLLFDDKINYKKIKIITCTPKNLPDFKGKNVFLSIDADYISNSGFDTNLDFKIRRTKRGVNKGFYEIFKLLEEKNIRPRIISLSLSPQYLPKKHHKTVTKIFEYIIEASNLKDEITTYSRKYNLHIPVKKGFH